MKRIASFRVDHTLLEEGIYVSRKDCRDGVTVTTFDLRFTLPNREPAMDMGAVHTVEHLGATYLRNSAEAADIVYFGPMGCRTGFYLLLFGDLESRDVLPLVEDMCEFILDFEGEIPGARPEECGNYIDQNLAMAKYYVKKYLDALKAKNNLYYPGEMKDE